MKNFHPPKSFLVIVNKNNEPIEILPKSVSMEDISFITSQKNKENSYNSPHSVVLWNGSVWFPFHITYKI